MKRYGYLIEKIVEESNLLEAFSMVMRGKKRTRTVRLFKKNRDKILADLAYEIKSGEYAPEGFREFEVVENGKVREIQSLPFKDRIALHAIMAVLYREVLGGMMIRDTYASLPKRGIHDGLNRLRKALKDRSNTEYCLKLDLKKFYHSIDQDVLIELLLKRLYKAGVKFNDFQYVDLYDEYKLMKSSGYKTTYIVALLSDKYSICERKVYSLIQHLSKDCKNDAV